MVFCIVALVVFGIMGIFSSTHRQYAKQAFRCVTRMMTLRPCDTEFDQRMKNAIVAKIIPRSEVFGRFVFRHFGKISWVFVIAMFVSLGYTVYGFYNLAVLGTCDPVNGNCIFNPGGDPNVVQCPFQNISTKNATMTINGFSKVNITVSEKPQIYFIGTTWCPHCAWEKPIFLNATLYFGEWKYLQSMNLNGAQFISDYFTIKIVEIDKVQNFEKTQEFQIFQHFSPQGQIPLLVLGGKYYRVGSGEAFGSENEKLALIALMCELSNKNDGICTDSAVTALIKEI